MFYSSKNSSTLDHNYSETALCNNTTINGGLVLAAGKITFQIKIQFGFV